MIEQVMSFDYDAVTQKKRKAFVRRIDIKLDGYRTMLEMIKEFLAKPLDAVVENSKCYRWWSTQITDGSFITLSIANLQRQVLSV